MDKEPYNNSISHNAGLRALLSIKGISATLDNDCSELQQIEREVHDAYKNGLLTIKDNSSPEESVLWKAVVQEVNCAVKGIHDTLSATNEVIAEKEKNGYPDLWKALVVHLITFNENSNYDTKSGWRLLPEAVHTQWKKEFVKLEPSLVESLLVHVDSCRVLLQMIEQYSTVELKVITRMISDYLPVDFTETETVYYQDDYNKALENFRKEFKKEKNLWNKFLDILAGGTHHSPPERIIIESWVAGEDVNPYDSRFINLKNAIHMN